MVYPLGDTERTREPLCTVSKLPVNCQLSQNKIVKKKKLQCKIYLNKVNFKTIERVSNKLISYQI